MKKHLASITILVENRQTHAGDMQKLLTENGHLILARLGVNPQRACIENCTGIIAVIVEGAKKDIDALTKKLNDLYGIVAKAVIMTK
jgi:hypothetical protein